jgi:predicted O-methyltransferase YrrM
MAAGEALDLEGCSYGEWRGDFVGEPHGYYYFLAGLVQTKGFTRIVEIGTHYGGATTAMTRGMPVHDSDDALVVTVDVTNHNAENLSKLARVRRVQGDSLDPQVVRRVCSMFDGPIDLLYVDSRHEHRETLQNIAVYANRLRPSMIVLDDIHLNDSMREMWERLLHTHRDQMTDVSDLVRRKSAGFGVIECRPTDTWPELRGVRQSGWMAFRRARRTIGPLVPARGKQLLRSPKSWRSRT